MLLMLAGLVGAGALATYYFAPWLATDIAYTIRLTKVLKAYLALAKARVMLVDAFEKSVRKDPKKTFLLFDDVAYSYGLVDERATKVAWFAKEIGLKCGDVVAMMVYNSPEFLWTFFGLQKLGIRVALLNTNVRSKSLQHCMSITEAKVVIFGKDLLDAVEGISDFLKTENYSVWIQGDHVPPAYGAMDEVMERQTAQPVDPSYRSSVAVNDPAVYIYTSGTTGLPKAAVLTTKRTCGPVVLIPQVLNGTSKDVVYIPLPMYHTSGFLIGIGGAVHIGCTIATRKKFSASSFWDDCRKYEVTIFLYIGELCRYLVNRPEQPTDKDHKVRAIIGNGLRPEIWKTFRERFAIPRIHEFYGATEGLGFFVNLGTVVGSVGRASPIFKKLYPMKFLKFDYEKETAYRGPDGRCVEAKLGETGLFVCGIEAGKIEFDGYKGKKELTEKKILKNVFKDGDVYFNSGDLLKTDDMYNVYFIDRVGDTFRWKGENVSTMEVGGVLSDEEKILHVNVYGVHVPDCDGRAGMAAITMNEGHEVTESFLSDMHTRVTDYLPIYARPLFLRIQKEVETTSTLKYIKGNVQKEGFDPSVVGEALYYIDRERKTYSPLSNKVHEEICSRKIKF